MKILNQIPVYEDKNVGTIKLNGQQYYVCAVCGRLNYKKVRAYGITYCNKHYKQQKKYGVPLDDNPRTVYDKNEIRIDGDIAYMDIYNEKGIKIAETVFDTEDVPKVRYIKWKLSNSGYVMNTPKYRGSNKHLSRTILETDQFVDHIDQNPLNNRKPNLRIVSKSQNAMNQKQTAGVSYNKDTQKWIAHIKKDQKMLNLGVYVDVEEALWARWFAERILFKEYAANKPEPYITDKRKIEISEYELTPNAKSQLALDVFINSPCKSSLFANATA